jgi:hypothetical protein
MKKIIIEIDGQETEYESLTACAKAIGVPVATIYGCASYGYRCKGYAVRYSDGTRRPRRRGKKAKTTQMTADGVVDMIAHWYIGEWKEYVSADALVSMTQFIRKNWDSWDTTALQQQ